MLSSFCNPKEKRSKIIGCLFASLKIDRTPEELKSIIRNTEPLSLAISFTSESSIWINPWDVEISPASTIVIWEVPRAPKERVTVVSLKSEIPKSFSNDLKS